MKTIPIHCPFCNSIKIGVIKFSDTKFKCSCNDCKASGPLSENLKEAVSSWNNHPEEQYWKSSSIYLTSLHAICSYRYMFKSISKSKKKAQSQILIIAKNVLQKEEISFPTDLQTIDESLNNTVKFCSKTLYHLKKA